MYNNCVDEETLNLRLLGTPQVSLNNAPVSGFISAKSQALLYFLAVTARPHSRDSLAALLWGDMPEAQAAKNLRNALSNLRSLVGTHLEINRDDVSFNRLAPYWIDVEYFTQSLADENGKRDLGVLHNAVELYQSDFLEGFNPADALGFDEWLVGRRSMLKGLMLQALHTLVVRHLEREEYAAGIEYANRLLTIEPWREETHRHLMILLARSRQRSTALAQYETCRRVLKTELGVEPMPETVDLYNRIRAAAAPPPHNLPPQPTAFVGRESELAEIAAYLNNPNAQLLTLTGPGGIGKTRLALEAASHCVDPDTNVGMRFSDGVFLVPLVTESVASGGPPSRTLLEAMADALGFDLQGPVHPQARLLNYLHDKDMLLVLDNFEHLVDEARQLGDLLRLAPKVKLLVTSRARLNLQEEWLIEVHGLVVPANVEALKDPRADYSAVSLFVQQARRVRAGFTLTDADTSSIIRICQLVEGVPLCIELAASWLRVLTCREIAAELEKGLDFLTSTLQNVPERHRSLRAVFDHSWNLLSPAEQTTVRQLSVFHGGFQREAASRVVGASLPMLAGLVDKSILRRNAVGRYEIHDLLRQYAEEKLQADPPAYAQIGNLHCRYYAELMVQHQAQLKSEDVSVAITELNAERENVRAAWNWAMSQRCIEELTMFMECL